MVAQGMAVSVKELQHANEIKCTNEIKQASNAASGPEHTLIKWVP